jgi:hypothetical protein
MTCSMDVGSTAQSRATPAAASVARASGQLMARQPEAAGTEGNPIPRQADITSTADYFLEVHLAVPWKGAHVYPSLDLFWTALLQLGVPECCRRHAKELAGTDPRQLC